jgi:hypothetical protein
MGGFYKKLAEGKSKNIALQEAKLDFLVKNKETALVHPYYWSSFIVQGNTLPLVSRSNWLVYLSTIILLFLLVFLFRKKLAKLFK